MFSAYVLTEVTLDPCILFVVMNSGQRGKERVFWKYMSADFLRSINYSKDSCTLKFNPENELFDTDQSEAGFVRILNTIAAHHKFASNLISSEYNKDNILHLIKDCNRQICEHINLIDKWEKRIFLMPRPEV